MEASADRNSGRSRAQFDGPATTTTYSAGDRTEIPSASLCTIPFARNPHYAHRKSLERKVQDRLSVPGASVALVGLGGMGKTQIANEYAWKVKERSPATHVLWVRSSSAAHFEEDVRRILDQLRFGSADASWVDAMQLLQTWLQDSANGKWLLVLDNLDDDDFLHQQLSTSKTERLTGKALVDYLPHAGHGTILCTSRSKAATRRIVGDLDVFQVDAMQETDAVDLAKILMGNAVTSFEAAALVNAVDCMPLAIAQACGYISHHSSEMNVKTFLWKLHRSELSGRSLLSRATGHLNRDREASYDYTVTEAFNTAFRHVEVARPSASDLLGILSFFDPDCIPQQLVSLWHAEFRGQTFREGRKGRVRLLEHKIYDQDLDADIASLLALSLVKTQAAGSIIQMHRLVREEAQRWLDINGQSTRLGLQFLALINKVFSSDAYTRDFEVSQLIPHAVAAFNLKSKDRESRLMQASLLRNAGKCALDAGDAVTAERMQARSVRLRKASLGRESPWTMESMQSLMLTYLELGRDDVAERLRVEMTDIEQKRDDSGYASDESNGFEQEDFMSLEPFGKPDYLLRVSGPQVEPPRRMDEPPALLEESTISRPAEESEAVTVTENPTNVFSHELPMPPDLGIVSIADHFSFPSGTRDTFVDKFAQEIVEGYDVTIGLETMNYKTLESAIEDALQIYHRSMLRNKRQKTASRDGEEDAALTFIRHTRRHIARRVISILEHSAKFPSIEPETVTDKSDDISKWLKQSVNLEVEGADPPLAIETEEFEIPETEEIDMPAEGAMPEEYRIVQRMRTYLCVSTAFNWLRSRIHTVAKSASKDVWALGPRCLSRLMLSIGLDGIEYGIKIVVDWNLQQFMEHNYTGLVDIAEIIGVSITTNSCEASTVGEYMSRVWQITGPHFLRVLQDWWRQISDGHGDEPFERDILDGEVSFVRQSSSLHVEITAPLYLMVDIGEQLAWLGSICRKGSFDQSLTVVEPRVSRARDDGMLEDDSTLSIKFDTKEFTRDSFSAANDCWPSLFHNCCIAHGAFVNSRGRNDKGLEIPFGMMATLGGCDRVTYYAGQLVMKGFETLFVPMKKSGGSLVWHLIANQNGRRVSYNAMYKLSGRADSSVCIQDLYDSRHFLGWVSKVSQHTGTEDGVYDGNNEVFLEQPGQGFVLERVTISISKIVSIGTSITPGRQDRGIRTSNKEVLYTEVVEKMTKRHVLLYDHAGGRGWLVDGASAVLHLLRFHVAHYPPICDGETFKIDQFHYADPKAGFKSAKEVLLSRDLQDLVLVEELAEETRKQVTETIKGEVTVKTVSERPARRKYAGSRVLDLYEILDLMYDNWKRRKTAPGIALESLNAKLEGWKFQDIVELEDDMNPVVAKLDGGADDWLCMVRHINAVVLVGNGFGDILKPMGGYCANWDSVPQNDFSLAVSVSQLKRIARRHGVASQSPIVLIRPTNLTPGVYWPINHHPFTCTCGTVATGISMCSRSQRLRSNGLRSGVLQLDVLTATASEHKNGAVIFKGKEPSRQMVTPESPNLHVEDERPKPSGQTAMQELQKRRDKAERPAWKRLIYDCFPGRPRKDLSP